MYEQLHLREVDHTRLLSKHIEHHLQNYTLKLMHTENIQSG